MSASTGLVLYVGGCERHVCARTSKLTKSSASASERVTCQKTLQACRQPVFVGVLKEYASKSEPPLGSTMIAYSCDTVNVSVEPACQDCKQHAV